jgi:low temperature requirement protein LtrA
MGRRGSRESGGRVVAHERSGGGKRGSGFRLPWSGTSGAEPYAQAPEGERHATWLELFFDLVFVFAVAELGHYLHGHLTLAGLAGFALLFLPVWRVWMAFSYHTDLFGADDPGDRVAAVATMFGVVVLGLTVYGALDDGGGGSVAFAAAYSALRLLLVGMYARTWRRARDARGFAARYAAAFSIVAALWAVSIFVPEPWRFVLWGAAILTDLATGPIVYLTSASRPTQISHMSERFGLFVIIVLGESIIAVGTGVADTDWRWQGVIAAVAGFFGAVCIWWLYFDKTDESVINRAVRSDRGGILRSFVYGYAHYLVYAGITAASVGVLASIEAADSGALALGGRLALCGGIATFLLGAIASHHASPASLHEDLLWGRALCAALLVALGLGGGPLPPAALAVLTTLLLAGLAVYELAHPSRNAPVNR